MVESKTDQMNIENFLKKWIAVSNLYQAENYLEFFHPEAILDDPSVGREFIGHEGILDYFNSYFIGYRTQTKIVDINIRSSSSAVMIVEFTGNFPQKKLGGSFEIYLSGAKISKVLADLIF